jgi:prepilin-type N-terminal cleavage/methylation domain-containing protein
MKFPNAPAKGFTLAELLIALAILGVIATFTIPKLLNSATSGQSTSIAKEVASMVSGSFAAYQQNNTLAAAATAGALTQYMNYVSVDTSGNSYGFTGSGLCSTVASVTCLQLHNGGVLEFDPTNTFGGSGTTNAVYFNIDPDGAGPLTGATFIQYYNGRLTTAGNALAGTASTNGAVTIATDPAYIQNWN